MPAKNKNKQNKKQNKKAKRSPIKTNDIPAKTQQKQDTKQNNETNKLLKAQKEAQKIETKKNVWANLSLFLFFLNAFQKKVQKHKEYKKQKCFFCFFFVCICSV